MGTTSNTPKTVSLLEGLETSAPELLQPMLY